MALTLVNLSDFQRGVASDELGINIKSFRLQVEPEINDWLPGKDGQARGKAVGDPMGKLTIAGEVSSLTTASSMFVATFVAAFVPVNSVTFLGRSAGGFYMDSGELEQERDGWRSASCEFTSKFNVA